MITTYNPTIQTYNEEPTNEATKAAEMVSRYLFWITNQSSRQRLIDAFGNVLGDHFWRKLCASREKDSFHGDMMFWFELSEGNRRKIMHYILRTEYRRQ